MKEMKMHGHHGEYEQGKHGCMCEEHAGHMGYEQGEMGGMWPGHMGMMCGGHGRHHGMMRGMGVCPICERMMGGMWPGHMGMKHKMCRGHGHHHWHGHHYGMMGGMCPICGRMMKMGAGEEEEGPNRGKGPAKRTDEQIKAEVEQVLTDDSWLDASNIQVIVQGGVVTLTGTVDSRDSKFLAEDLVDWISGVKDVQNNLQIQAG